jgi:hypothetical protein
MIVALAIAAALAAAALLALAVAKATRTPGRHAAARGRVLRIVWHTPRWFPPRLWLYSLGRFLADLLARLNALRPENPTDEDELWVDGLTVRKTYGPPAPARRPQALTVARVRTAALIRAIPLDAVPWLQKGHGYNDTTGAFEALTAPPLHAHESASITQADLAAGLAAQHAKEWGP